MPTLNETDYVINLAYSGTYGTVVLSCTPYYLMPVNLTETRNQLLGVATTNTQLQRLLQEVLDSSLFQKFSSPKQRQLLANYTPHAKLPPLCQKGIKYLAHLDYTYRTE